MRLVVHFEAAAMRLDRHGEVGQEPLPYVSRDELMVRAGAQEIDVARGGEGARPEIGAVGDGAAAAGGIKVKRCSMRRASLQRNSAS